MTEVVVITRIIVALVVQITESFLTHGPHLQSLKKSQHQNQKRRLYNASKKGKFK